MKLFVSSYCMILNCYINLVVAYPSIDVTRNSCTSNPKLIFMYECNIVYIMYCYCADPSTIPTISLEEKIIVGSVVGGIVIIAAAVITCIMIGCCTYKKRRRRGIINFVNYPNQ